MPEPPSITERFPPPPLEEVVSLIEDFGRANEATRRATIRRLVGSHAVLSYRWGGPWRYRRARRITDQPRPDRVSDLIWRDDVPALLGRANAAGYRVLYLADRRDTALSEVRADDDQVVVTEFQVRPGRSVLVTPIGELSQIQRTGRGILTSEAAAALTGMLNVCDRDVGRAMLIVDAFLLECLSNREDAYALSSAVAMATFEKLPEVDAIAYPSRRQQGAVNFAVRADRLWRDWGITAVQEAHARHLAMGYFRLTRSTHVTGITRAGELVWSRDASLDEEATVLLDPPWHPGPDYAGTGALRA